MPSRGPPIEGTHAYGFDVVLAIDPSSYEVTHTGDGVGYAFQMDDATRQQLAGAVKQALDRPGDVESLEIDPGCIRIQVYPTTETAPVDLVAALQQVSSIYNERHAEEPALDGLQVGEHYVGTYRPESRTDAEAFLEQHTGSEAVPDVDGPIYEYDRDLGPAAAGAPERHIAYEFIFLFDPEMYEVHPRDAKRGTQPFEWRDAVLNRIEVIAEDTQRWPGGGDGLGRLAIFPEYLVIHLYSGSTRAAIDEASKCWSTLVKYNQHIPARETPGDRPDRQGQPIAIKRRPVYIGALPPEGASAEDWIEANGLGEEDGAPREPEADAEAGAPDGWNKLSPFGGS